MLFNSFPFVFLMLITFLLFYLPILGHLQTYILIVSSLVFYAYHNPALLLLLISSILINAGMSYGVHYGRLSTRKMLVTIGVAINLGILIFFKYNPLLSEMIKSEIGKADSIGDFLLSIPLPIGISFYTFEGISLLIDVYRGSEQKYPLAVPKNLFVHIINTCFFVSFFPHLIAGPILKAHDFFPQITPKFFKDINWIIVFKNLVLGYFLKMVVADNLKDLTYWLAFPYFQNLSSSTLLTMLFGYSMQIFADFAGYSLIAIGLARAFGYKLMDNFMFPYISQSFSEFWQRWHISLSTWLKEYLYIPLGGNRKGNVRTYLNLLLVMLLGGLWHGAAWSYAVWGAFHGIALALERFFQNRFTLPSTLTTKIFRTVGVFIFVTFAWLLFKLPNFDQVILFVEALVKNYKKGVKINTLELYILLYSIPVIVYHIHYLCKHHLSYNRVFVRTEPYWLALALFLIIVNSGSTGSFIYFQF